MKRLAEVMFRKDPLPRRSVLIVDDDPAIRGALCELFARENDLDVCGEAENGRDAIEKARQGHGQIFTWMSADFSICINFS